MKVELFEMCNKKKLTFSTYSIFLDVLLYEVQYNYIEK